MVSCWEGCTVRRLRFAGIYGGPFLLAMLEWLKGSTAEQAGNDVYP
jgi:hypothetical protein